MATTRFYLDRRGRAKDGRGSVLICLYHNGTTASFSTGVRASASEWNVDRVIKVSGAEAINTKLQEQRAKIDKAIAILSLDDHFDTMTAAEIKRKLKRWNKIYLCQYTEEST